MFKHDKERFAMRKSGLGITNTVIVCFILTLLLLPCAGKTYAQGSFVKIDSPADGQTINSPEFDVTITYSLNFSTGYNCGINAAIDFMDAGTDYTVQSHFPIRITDQSISCVKKGAVYSNTITSHVNLNKDKNGQAFTAPEGKYMIRVNLYQGGTSNIEPMVGAASAKSTFYYGTATPEPVTPPSVTLNVAENLQYIEINEGQSVTLSWNVAGGATSTSLTQETRYKTEEIAQKMENKGNKTVTPTTTTRYTLTATNAKGGKSKQVFVRVRPKTPPSEEEVKQDRKLLLDMYYKLDLKGSSYFGGIDVNIISCAAGYSGTKVIEDVEGTKIIMPTVRGTGGGIVCGDYEQAILKWLDALRWNPKTSHLLDGLDYTPIRLMGGAHNYVMLYQKGQDWKKTGVRLDPWMSQETSAYTTADDPSNAVGGPDTSAGFQGQYPLTGSGGKYPNPGTEMGRSLPPTDKKHVGLKCPVNSLITNQAGKRIGLLTDGTPVNEIPEAGFLTYPEDDGTLQWYFVLPIEETYKTEITGTGDGTFQLITGGGKGPIQDYGEQPISKGQQADITFDPGNPAAELVLPDGKKVIPEELEIESFVTSEEPEPGTQPEPGTEPEPTPYTFNLFPIIMAMAGVVVVAVTVGTIRRRRAARAGATNTVTASRTKAPPPPAASARRPEPSAASRARGRGVSCGKCDYQNPVGAEFCTKCGAPLDAIPATRACPECGDPIAEDEKFCNKCGAKVKAVSRSKFCSKCGDPITEDENFCNKCGAKIKTGSRPKFCSKCGDPIAKGEKFCDKCGAKQV
jgi:predicted nucleic acid-binding Zn ribbon protein